MTVQAVPPEHEGIRLSATPVAVEVRTRVFVSSPLDESAERLKALQRSPISFTDIAGVALTERYGQLFLREDGAIVAKGSEAALGQVVEDGDVTWHRMW